MTTADAIKNENVTLVDVREEMELETDGKIDNAIHIPLGEVPSKLEEFKEMSAPIVVFCRAGGRSSKAIEFLQAQGVENLYNGGGYEDVIAVLEDA